MPLSKGEAGGPVTLALLCLRGLAVLLRRRK
ncbi:MAG: MYXO-CTERM sorting domain-containing protein [Phycisphaerae bacterium]